jgi:hypothetical protein
MESKDDDTRKKEKQTPIIDGDARPDLNIHGDERGGSKDHPIEIPGKKKEVTTKNRNDTNSLEDYKDAKLE